MLIMFSVITIVTALVCYTVGVWSEKFAGRLKPWHLAFFWTGLIFDTAGTSIMASISGKFTVSIHTVTGVAAIILMAFHSIWASLVLYKKDEKAIVNFHKFSLVVWTVWLIPFLSGMILNMRH